MLVLASGILIIFIDQLSKWAVTASRAGPNLLSRRAVRQIRLIAKLGKNRVIFFTPLCSFCYSQSLPLVLFCLSNSAWPIRILTRQIALGGALGGAASNLLDRFWRGAVVDFIDLGFWPVFNLADVAICVGAFVALVSAH